MLTRILLSTAVLPVVAAPLAISELEFAPEAGSQVTKTVSSSTDFEVQELAIEVAGMDMTEMIGEVDLNIVNETNVSVTDTYDAVAEGHPKKLTRTFNECTTLVEFEAMMAAAGESESDATEMESQLSGESVIFTWNEESNEYDVAFANEESELDEELLGGLEEDMDLRTLLPEGDVAKGETWEVPLSAVGWILAPGGDLAWTNDDVESMDEDMEDMTEMFDGLFENMDEELEGKLVLTMGDVAEKDGVKIAQATVKLAIDSSMDMSDMLADLMDTMMGGVEELGGEMPEISIDQADVALEFEGEGVFEWNVTAGRAHAFTLAGEAIMSMEIAVGMSMEGESQDISATIELAGDYSTEFGLE